ncbi:Membrane protein involved in the export of O-antigen and teichoic acid [Nitrosospira multiformis]|uniref:Membrane protein involved in the export of O-antigen and teichoic acid n=1 Tax=Nitrosospira multiformis TaxID=1231 RepID=A0A1H8MBX9_9PROT|nr:oligosaccharide flippase family protein [Nitrosospira multiformis]SEO14932.1 Membrane protein involved in the export of O-antigen and teichoic acid [Nitrosospira multiformis]
MSLAVKSLSAVKSNYTGTIIRIAAQLIAQILIMRQLGPELVGTFGYAVLLHAVLALIIDQGFGWSLIQGHFNDKREIATAFSRIMLLSFISMLVVIAISYPIADYLGNELVGVVFRYSAPSYLFIGFFAISQSKLRAELRFREIQISTTGAYLVAYPIVGVAMALAGFGVWALVAAWYVQSILQVVIGHYYSPHSLRLTNPLQPTKSGPIGRQVAGINVLNWAVDNSGGVFVGSLGASSLGNFNAASMLARTPALHVVQTLQTILFSTASAIGDDQRRIKRLYLSALAGVSFIVFPAYGYTLTHAELIIKLVFGNKWVDSAGIFSAMSIGMIALAMSSLSGAILTATGDQKTVLYSQTACLMILILGLYLTINISLVYVGVAITAAYIARFLLQLKAIAVRGGIKSAEFISVIRGPFFMGIFMAMPVTQLGDFLPPAVIPIELLALVLKCLVLLALFKVFPHFFFSLNLTNLLERFSVGRRAVTLLGL